MVSGSSACFLVDCGVMAEEQEGFPRLNQSRIKKLQCVFLTHSHADHAGALPWLMEQGFTGDVIATGETLLQLPFPVKNSIPLETLYSRHKAEYRNISIAWGRSGHCVGSVWYHFTLDQHSIFFSGDYTEHTQVYAVDKIRGRAADLAVLDCACGNNVREYGACCETFLGAVQEGLRRHAPLFLPVPKYGRGLELLCLITERFPGIRCLGDEHFVEQFATHKQQPYWFKGGFCQDMALSLYEKNDVFEFDILFISDPQLKCQGARQLAEQILQQGGYGIMSGTTEKNTYSHALIQSGNMRLLPYPVHQHYGQYQSLCKENQFLKAIACHTPDFHCGSSRVRV